MPAPTAKDEFRCPSCGHRQPVRVQPRGCPVCHAPSPRRDVWVDHVLAERLRATSERVVARV